MGIATGLQKKFSFKQVGISALSSALTAGGGGPITGIKDAALAVANAVAVNAITQGVSIAAGVQNRFSWAGLAAAGVAAGIGAGFDYAGGGKVSLSGKIADAVGGGRFGVNVAHGVRGAALGLAGAATRSAIEGTSFGDAALAALPDIIGNAIGYAVAGRASRAIEKALSSPVEEPALATAVDALDIAPLEPFELELPELDRLGDTPQIALLNSRQNSAARASDGNVAPFSPAWWARLADDPFISAVLASPRDGRVSPVQREPLAQERLPTMNAGNVPRAPFLNFLLTGKFGGNPMAAYHAGNSTAAALDAVEEPTIALGLAGGAIAMGLEAAPFIFTRYSAGSLATAEGLTGLVPGMEAATPVAGLGVAGVAAHRAGVLDEVGDAAGALLRRVACFVAGTPIHTRDGLKAIEQIRVGDMVWSRSEHDVGDASWRKVTEWAPTGEQKIYEVSVEARDGRAETYRTTEMHPFWVETGGADGTGGFIAASLLKAGESVRLVDGSAARITSVTSTQVIEPVYNFSVEGWHTYHIGELGVWVHNDVCLGDIPFFNPNYLRPNQTSAVLDTLAHVKNGTTPVGPTATNWARTFNNNEGLLPTAIGGRQVAYSEYRVASAPFSQAGAGTHRIVMGETTTGRYYFYTTTHYGTDGTARQAFWRIR